MEEQAMEHKRIGFIISIMLLILLSACQMGTATPTSVNCNQTGCPYPAICDLKSGVCTINQPQGPGAVAPQQPGAGLIQAAPTSTTPTAEPTASSGCNQLGCPYPAVCDKYSGVCTINQSQGPGAAAPQAPGAGIIANNPGANSLVPACPPPPLTIGKTTSFCANPSANQGGATIVWSDNPVTPQAFSSYYVIEDGYQLTSGKDTCTNNDTVCSGPQNTNVVINMCSVCSTASGLTWNGFQGYLYQGAQNSNLIDPFVCPTGYTLSNGQCVTPSNSQNGYTDTNADAPLFPCASGTHYDNGKQNCVDDVTGKISSPCPPGYPYLLAGMPGHYPAQCYKNPFPVAYNCQSYTIPLGECTAPSKRSPKCTTSVTGIVTCH
jgi:hypothetical protein